LVANSVMMPMTPWQRLRVRWRDAARTRTMVWALLISVVCGVTGLLEPVDDMYRNLRYLARYEKADQTLVVVGMDQKSLERLTDWPWSRRQYAEMIDKLKRAGAKRIVFDKAFADPDTPENDRVFREVVERYRPSIYLGVGFGYRRGTTFSQMTLPAPSIRSSVEMATFKSWLNPLGQYDEVYLSASDGKRRYPSLSAVLSNRQTLDEGRIRPDYSIRASTFPYVSVIDIMTMPTNELAQRVAGRDILFGLVARGLNDIALFPGQGRMAGVFNHAIATQTLKRGTPMDLGWMAAMPFVLLFCLHALLTSSRRALAFSATAGASLALAAPLLLDAALINVDIAPALLALTIVAIQSARLRYGWLKSRTNVNSGLSNVVALREAAGVKHSTIIAAKVGNYAAIVTSFPKEVEASLVSHIVERLRVRDSSITMYQGDDGVFFWTTPLIDHDELGAHLEGLHSFFGQPVIIDGHRVDVALTLGADTDLTRSVTSRTGSALLSAEEAAATSSRWRIYNPSRVADATWVLALPNEIDRAIEQEQFWLAFQPKVEIATGRMTGAEVLLRWTHPERGAISPAEFIPAAERANKIGRLTAYVLRRAVAALWHLSREGDYKLAVNISVPALAQSNFTGSLIALCQRQKVDPARLTLEITESTLIATDDSRIDATLFALREHGFGLSIDDFGTGFSSLDYVRRIPAHEMKIDQTFVRRMLDSPADRVVVESVLHMAHTLDRRVVAEGVETRETLDLLAQLGCDEVQGYLVGRPVDFDTFMAPILAAKRAAA
jgi:diguanylate cyclase